jgi:hypothetical protein
MRAFQDYEIGWNGRNYVIPSDQLLSVIAAMEEHITLSELTARRGIPLGRLSQAYAVVLRRLAVRGADGKLLITDREVYTGMFNGGDLSGKVMAAVEGLIGLMIPPEDHEAEQAAPGKSRGLSRSSKRSTKRSLARAG